MPTAPNTPRPLPDIPEVWEARVLAAHLDRLRKDLDQAQADRRELFTRMREAGCTWPQIATAFSLTIQRVEQIAAGMRAEDQAPTGTDD